MNLIVLPVLFGVFAQIDANYCCCFADLKANAFIESKRTSKNFYICNKKFVRGVLFFYCVLFLLFCNANKQKQYLNANKQNLWKNICCWTAAICSCYLFFWLVFLLFPNFVAMLIFGTQKVGFAFLTIKVFLRILVLVCLLFAIKSFAKVKQFYRFNGACNVCVFKSHHKPTNFLNFLLFSFFCCIIIVGYVAPCANNFLTVAINFAILNICFSVCYEVLAFLEKSRFWILCKITSVFVCEKPNVTEIDFASAALCEVQLMKNKRRKQLKGDRLVHSFSNIYNFAKTELQNFDISEVDFLICNVLKIGRSVLPLQTSVTEKQKQEIESAVAKRKNGMPISKIFNFAEFYGWDFYVDQNVLSPRMETEILVDKIATTLQIDKKTKICDLCTGSGIIAICLALLTKSTNITAVDISAKALSVAQKNAQSHNVEIEFVLSNLFESIKKTKKFDIIVSNPPYIPTAHLQLLDKEVLEYDPKIALDGGDDGLDFYREIILQSKKHLVRGGYLCLEIGIGQSADICELLKDCFEDVQVFKDYGKIDRVIFAKLK